MLRTEVQISLRPVITFIVPKGFSHVIKLSGNWLCLSNHNCWLYELIVINKAILIHLVYISISIVYQGLFQFLECFLEFM